MPSKKDFDVSFMSTPSEVRKRVMNMKYEGDPDLYPVRSYESTVLVRMLYDISLNINKRVSEKTNFLNFSTMIVFSSRPGFRPCTKIRAT